MKVGELHDQGCRKPGDQGYTWPREMKLVYAVMRAKGYTKDPIRKHLTKLGYDTLPVPRTFRAWDKMNRELANIPDEDLKKDDKERKDYIAETHREIQTIDEGMLEKITDVFSNADLDTLDPKHRYELARKYLKDISDRVFQKERIAQGINPDAPPIFNFIKKAQIAFVEQREGTPDGNSTASPPDIIDVEVVEG